MKLETLDILNRKAYAAVGDITPEDRLDALHHFRSSVGKMWPVIYRELMAARAMRDAMDRAELLQDVMDGYILDTTEPVDAYDAARRETDK